MKNNSAARSLLVLVFVLGVARNAFAEFGVTAALESFRWHETTTPSVEETGPRLHLGANWRRWFGPRQELLLDVRGSLYFGHIDYDGAACNGSGSCVPFKTDANYQGSAAEAIFARRFGADSGGEIFGGGGIDLWRRDIKGGNSVLGPVSGAIEDWTVLYALAGAGTYWTSHSARSSLRAGIKYPFSTTNYSHAFDVTVNPKGRASAFLRFSSDFLTAGRPRWGYGIYYDSYRFGQSESERISLTQTVLQPESKQDVFGLYGTIYF